MNSAAFFIIGIITLSGALAAATLPNDRGHLGGWISNPHSIKQGVRMPANPLAPDELNSLLGYLESLQ